MTVSRLFSVMLGVFLALGLAAQAGAADKKKDDKEKRLSGRVQMISKDTSTITIRASGATRYVVYNADTKYTFRNAPSSLDEVKDGRRVICLGKFDEKVRLVATRIDVREK